MRKLYLHKYGKLLKVAEMVGANIYIVRLGQIVYATEGNNDDIDEIRLVVWGESHYFVRNGKRHYVIYTPKYMIKIIIDADNKGWINIARVILEGKLY